MPTDATTTHPPGWPVAGEDDLFEIRAVVRASAKAIAPLWPVGHFKARNPLMGLEDMRFDAAGREAERLFGGRSVMSLSDYRDRLVRGEISMHSMRACFAEWIEGLSQDPAIRALPFDFEAYAWSELIDEAHPIASPSAHAKADALSTPLLGLRTSAIAPALRGAIDQQTIKWCNQFFGDGAAALPNGDQGLFAAWRRLARYDESLSAVLSPTAKARLATLPETADRALVAALRSLGHNPRRSAPLLEAHLACLPGWAGYIKKRGELPRHILPRARLLDFLALRLSLQALMSDEVASSQEVPAPASDVERLARLIDRMPGDLDLDDDSVRAQLAAAMQASDEIALGAVFLRAAERDYRAHLLAGLTPETPGTAPSDKSETDRPLAQVFFCIDIRSEPYRLVLEEKSAGTVETLGCGGFFGLPIHYTGLTEQIGKDLFPALVSAKHDIIEQPLEQTLEKAFGLKLAAERNSKLGGLWERLMDGVATPFALAMASGAPLGAMAATRTLSPRLFARLQDQVTRNKDRSDVATPRLALGQHPGNPDRVVGLSLEEQVFYAQTLIALTGLKAPFGRFIVMAGHGEHMTNHPYHNAFGCSACGGNSGAPNARLMAAIFNAPEVRARLKELGHEIPDDTRVLAGEHDTVTDEIKLFGTQSIDATHREDLDRLVALFDASARANRARRAPGLGIRQEKADAALLKANDDWAELRPEWGLAGNASFIIAGRSLTQRADLKGRAFLHSYDWRTDPDGTALNVIMSGALVVGQWINCQYYFSAIDNEVYGSGRLPTQNVVGGIGIIQGNDGDLRQGLPYEALFADDGRLMHEPLRLLAVVEAPARRLMRLLSGNDAVRRLVDNEWMMLQVLDPETGDELFYRPGRGWQSEAGTVAQKH